MEVLPKKGIICYTLRILQMFLLFFATIVATSCEHKELCYDHLHTARINVIFDWMYAPTATPKGMTLYLFSQTKSTTERYDFMNMTGGEIVAFADDYTAVCVNNDTENIRYTTAEVGADTDVSETMVITTATGDTPTRLNSISTKAARKAPRASTTEDQRIALEPDMIWTDRQRNLTFVKGEALQTLTLYPQQAFCTYTVRVLNVDNIENVTEFSATLSGLAGGYIPSADQLTDELVTVPFEMAVDLDRGEIDGTFLTFGHCPGDADNSHIITVYAVMSDGSKYYSNIDVTEQVHNAADQRNVEIVVDGLPLPAPSMTGGFDLTVDTWNTIVIELEME
jgi:hypothetical protein